MTSVFLEQMEVRQFRNLLPQKLSFPARLNVIYGDNAQGKTNLLEAIYMLASLRSFRAARNAELIRWNENAAVLKGELRTGPGQRAIEIRLARGSKRISLDGKALRSSVDYAHEVKVVLFTPEDLYLVRGSKAKRRDFLDRAIHNLYPRYLSIVRDYNRVIAQKSRLLSRGDFEGSLIEAWTQKQVELGSHILATRQRFVNRVGEMFRGVFREVSQMEVCASIEYYSEVGLLSELDGGGLRKRFRQSVEERRQEEARRGVVLVGPHRDDLKVLLDGRGAGAFGSQGQTRILSLCLKIIELKVLLEERSVLPVFLLDDVSSELDRERNQHLMRYLSGVGCQVFVTTTAAEHVCVDAFSEAARYEVSAGKVIDESTHNSMA